MSERGSTTTRRKVRSAIVLMLAVVLALSATGIAAAQTRVRITYFPRAHTPLLRLCTGETQNMEVFVNRLIYRAGPTPTHFFVGGGRVLAVIDDPSIGHFDPDEAGRDVVGGQNVPPRAIYKFVADTPGRTTIDLDILTTGEEATLGEGWDSDSGSVDVEVNDCYQAHTSGLGSIFVDKEMGGLNRPFLLTAYTPNTRGITTETQIMFFIPNPQDPLNGGHYAFVDTANALLGGLQSSCTAYVTGRYDVVFHIPPEQPAPPGADVGDLAMYGRGIYVCDGRATLNIDYGTNYGFLISFKPKAGP